ncbi:MAG: hypothetical protein RQ752_06700 [Thermohalobaculum sp.]|nr:hypothetical protein [Thermohalobaculum sp.]
MSKSDEAANAFAADFRRMEYAVKRSSDDRKTLSRRAARTPPPITASPLNLVPQCAALHAQKL